MTNRFTRAALRAGLGPTLAPALVPILASFLVITLAAPARAHAVLERREATPNAAYRGVVQIMHGCDGAATTRVTVTIPEGVIGAKPMPKPGWTLATTRAAYARSYQSFHGMVSEGVNTITWSGGSLGDDEVDEFTFFARISDAFAPGSTVYFPVEQECAAGGERGSIAWTQVPTEGQDAHALKTPAPGVRIVAARTTEKTTTEKTAERAGEAAAKVDRPIPSPAPSPASVSEPVRAGDLTITGPWLRATPNGAKVAGGYVTIANAGGSTDRLVGAEIPQAGRVEVHAMSMEDGVMKMAPVEGGLAVAPGSTVALKPGGFHLMFLDLKDGLKAGETVKGSLRFAQAGTVPVTFTVAPIDAQAPGGGSGGHEH